MVRSIVRLASPVLLTSLAVIACSAPPSDSGAVGRASEAVESSASYRQDIPTPAECDAFKVSIAVPLGQGSWASDTPVYSCPGIQASNDQKAAEWIAGMEAVGCVTPGSLSIPGRYATSLPSGLSFSVCPDAVLSLPLPPQMEGIPASNDWADFEFECNSVVPVPPRGWINVAWPSGSCAHPSGCKSAGCCGLPVPVTGTAATQ